MSCLCNGLWHCPFSRLFDKTLPLSDGLWHGLFWRLLTKLSLLLDNFGALFSVQNFGVRLKFLHLFTENAKVILLKLISFSKQWVEGLAHPTVVWSQSWYSKSGNLHEIFRIVHLKTNQVGLVNIIYNMTTTCCSLNIGSGREGALLNIVDYTNPNKGRCQILFCRFCLQIRNIFLTEKNP